MSEKHFEVIEHTADWAIRVTGKDLAHLFRHAAEGMNHLMVGAVETVPLAETRTVTLSAYDRESLLVDWLNELAYWAEMEQFICRYYDLLEVTSTTLNASVRGGGAPSLHKHIKAVTFHNLAILENDDVLETTIVFDV